MRSRARAVVNKGYAWLEENPVTGLLVAGGLSGIAVLGVLGLSIYSKQTFEAKTACTKDPAGAACAAIREEIARAEPIRNPCIGYQRVTRKRGRACPKDFVGLSRGRRTQFQAGSREAQGGEAATERTPSPNSEVGTSGGTPERTKMAPKSQKPQQKAKPETPPVDIPADTSAPTTSATPAPATPEPGSSGETPAVGAGTKTCIELVVSACVDVGLPGARNPSDGG